MERRETAEEEVRVKWANWDGPESWVRLSANPELATFLTQNDANPDSTTLARQTLGDCDVNLPDELMTLRQLIHDSLGQGRHTSEGNLGRQTRVSLKPPLVVHCLMPISGPWTLQGFPRGRATSVAMSLWMT